MSPFVVAQLSGQSEGTRKEHAHLLLAKPKEKTLPGVIGEQRCQSHYSIPSSLPISSLWPWIIHPLCNSTLPVRCQRGEQPLQSVCFRFCVQDSLGTASLKLGYRNIRSSLHMVTQ